MLPPFPDGTISTFSPNTPNYIFSNFYSHSVQYEGITYPTTEHAYQAAKSLDDNVRRTFTIWTSAQAKKMGREIILRPDWGKVKLQVMYDLLQEKFSDQRLRRLLLETGDCEIIEGNYWHDIYWGQCFCPKHQWEGQNFLGRLLKKVRSEIDS